MSILITTECEPISRAMPGVLARVSKAGPSIEPSFLENRRYGSAQSAWLRYGHASHAQIEVRPDVLIIAIVHDANGGGRWDGRSVADGDVFALAPGSTHFASMPMGFDIGMLIVEKKVLAGSIESLCSQAGHDPTLLVPPRTAASIVSFHSRMRHGQRDADEPSQVSGILDAVTWALSGSTTPQRDHAKGELRDHRIVVKVLDYLGSVDASTAPMPRLCEASGVSERRIEIACMNLFGTPPSVFLRMRALSAARTRLLAASASTTTVSRVAADHGFNHPGRFSKYYRATYGEPPSATLASARA